jgi:BirA family biotin operon repressor/biotin-[acetyl-CoA-carboxylase] ligase
LPQEELRGRFDGLDDSGALLLRLPDGARRSISAGDVFFDDQALGR